MLDGGILNMANGKGQFKQEGYVAFLISDELEKGCMSHLRNHVL